MNTRIVLGSLMIVVLAAVLWTDWWMQDKDIITIPALPLAVVAAPLWIIAFLELARLAAACGVRLLRVSGSLGVVAIATLPFMAPLADGDLAALFLLPWLIGAFAVMAVFAEQMIRYRTDGALKNVACTIGATFYLGVGGALILLIRLIWGVEALVLFLAAVKFTDIGAYFVGSAIGKHKLIPWLSPGKSWEGLAGGLATAAAVSVLAARLFDSCQMQVWHAAVFGILVGLSGQFGDLCESLLKRSAGAKDAGTLVPQFGGVLDIIDSPLLAAPVALAALSLMG